MLPAVLSYSSARLVAPPLLWLPSGLKKRAYQECWTFRFYWSGGLLPDRLLFMPIVGKVYCLPTPLFYCFIISSIQTLFTVHTNFDAFCTFALSAHAKPGRRWIFTALMKFPVVPSLPWWRTSVAYSLGPSPSHNVLSVHIDSEWELD